MILDTTFIIDLIKADINAVNKFKELKEKRLVTTPTIFELWSGIVQSNKPEQEKRKILEILDSQLILNLDRKSAEEAGKISGSLVKEGKTIDSEDSMIAGIAKVYNEKILTRNIEHFSRIKEIEIETY